MPSFPFLVGLVLLAHICPAAFQQAADLLLLVNVLARMK
jgi:hypothetical protein